MVLLSEVKEYIKNASGFDEKLALEIIEFQMEHIPFYREFIYKLTGKLKFHSIKEVPPFPVEYFKNRKLTTLEKIEGNFLSSGTTGNRSRIYYSKKALELYSVSAKKLFPLKGYRIITPIDLSKKAVSSLAYMLYILDAEYRELSQLPEILEDGDVLFLTALQLHELVEKMEKIFEEELFIIETGGYKRIKKGEYNRFRLYEFARAKFPRAIFLTEYGMTELFSQFYAFEHTHFIDMPFIKVFTENYGYLKVFDFANLFHISYLYVPDIILKFHDGFEFVKRDRKDERGCSYTFGAS